VGLAQALTAPTVAAVGRCRVMGILNVTPDSFSDGGSYDGVDRAVEHGLAMVADGADLVDVGGESTRPGAARVSEAEELRRTIPVVAALASAGVRVSIDTMRASVAFAAIEAGAAMVNDVSGGLADPLMAPTVAESSATYVAMHWRGHSDLMQHRIRYVDVVEDVRRELAQRVDALVDAGLDPSRLVLDPGLGFGKLPEHSWELLRRLDRLVDLGFPLLVGASRKSFLGPAEVASERDDRTVAVTALAVCSGASYIRVHDVGPNRDAVGVARSWAGRR
jgi:dihydropteroate synthase